MFHAHGRRAWRRGLLALLVIVVLLAALPFSQRDRILAGAEAYLYGADGDLIANPVQRYALRDREPLVFNADGSLDLWIQADAPAADKKNNWPSNGSTDHCLPARAHLS